MPGEKVLVVDDELPISDLLRLYLKRENYEVIVANEGYLALELVRSAKPDLIILDVLLPGLDGIELCQKIRSETTVPILFLSCKGEDTDKVLGLGVGADDYITKPFSPSELVARVKAHLRRNQMLSNPGLNKNILSFPDLEINLNSYTVKAKGSIHTLPAKEFRLLSVLAQNPNRLFSTEHLFELVWGQENLGDLRTVGVHISSLRKKIEKNPSKPEYIITVRGVGYKFNV